MCLVYHLQAHMALSNIKFECKLFVFTHSSHYLQYCTRSTVKSKVHKSVAQTAISPPLLIATANTHQHSNPFAE